jgi:hypothetical protein
LINILESPFHSSIFSSSGRVLHMLVIKTQLVVMPPGTWAGKYYLWECLMGCEAAR